MTRRGSPGTPDAHLQRLEVRKVVRASPERLFSASTNPDQLRRWWGPIGATCPSADVWIYGWADAIGSRTGFPTGRRSGSLESSPRVKQTLLSCPRRFSTRSHASSRTDHDWDRANAAPP